MQKATKKNFIFFPVAAYTVVQKQTEFGERNQQIFDKVLVLLTIQEMQ